MTHPTHVVCPHCHAVNRLSASQLSEEPDCGHCHQALFMAQPLQLTTQTFGIHISRSQLPVLVAFWASWYAPCKALAPQLVVAAGLLEPRMRLAQVNVDEEPRLANLYAIRSIPTLMLFKNGMEMARRPGATNAASIVEWAEARLEARL